MKLKRFLLYNGFNKLQNSLLVPSYGSKIARTLRLVLSDNPTVMVLFMLLRICDLNYRILSHHLYISKNKNKKTHCACKWSYRFHFDPIHEKWFNDHTRNNSTNKKTKKHTAPVNDPTWCVLNAMTNNSNSTNNIQILVDATSKIFFILVIKFYGVPLYRPTTYKTKIMFLVEFYKTFEKKLSFSLPTSLEFLYTRLVKKDINLSYTLLCCIISPKCLGSATN